MTMDKDAKIYCTALVLAAILACCVTYAVSNSNAGNSHTSTEYKEYDMDYELTYGSLNNGQLSAYVIRFTAPADGYLIVTYNSLFANHITFHEGYNSLMFYRSTNATTIPSMEFYVLR